ncbi:SusC/RagA family TonB-linked outer membrane protein [Niabella soli]|uniref:TonB-denpendent receptor n=1 Tax=Niabella soli DSM 19437 TaxID=929713 RepID=W0EWE3_9BACT|nr:TonB-dependent receptor [Niabella soli]AHF15115.1 TonB-denpendent receptor [Niabella soli DSM 19437]
MLKYRRLFLLFIFLLFLTALVQAQHPATVTGKVTDNTGQPMEGATIQVKGSAATTISDKDGNFKITVPAQNAVLLVTNVGYDDQQVSVGKQTQLTVSMKASTNSMNEIVVIGYGTAKRRDVTGAVSSMSGKGIEEKPVTRIDQAMIGQLAGVQVQQQTGMPGQGLSIVVRGTGSVSSGTEPLYVVDGFPLDVVAKNSAGGFTSNPLNNLNPDDIESIQVLKDAAAAAIYGSRAANGVVMITTKRGQIGKPRISANINGGFSQIARKLDLLSAQEWVDMATELANAKWVASGTGRTADQTNAQRRTILGLAPTANNYTYMTDDRWTQPGHPGLTYVDWQDKVFRKAPFQNYQLSASGGTESVRYYFSGSYLNQDGVLLNSGYKNYSGRANLEVNPSKRLKMGLNLAPSYAETRTPGAEGKDNILMKMYSMAPIAEDTSGLATGAGKNSVYGWSSSSVSPVAYLNNTINFSKTNRILASVYADLQIIPGLNARTTVNYDDQNLNRKTYTSDYVAGNITNYLTAPGKSSSGSYSGNKKQTFVNENTLSYNKTFGDHSLSAVGGFTYNYVHLETFTISTAGGFANDIVTTLNGAIPSTAGVTVTGNTTESNNSMLSYYGRAIYNYADKYMLQGSIRRDASSRFGKESRWGTFPAAAASWRISQEPFMKNSSLFSDLKLRASWGKSGSSNIGDYANQQTFSNTAYSFGGSSSATAVSGVTISGLSDPKLHWETSNTYNLGIDASFLKNRINLIVDAYQKKTTDQFLRLPVLATSGFTAMLTNFGAVMNQGIEFTVNSVNIRKGDFQWSTNANIAFNKNKVVELNGDAAVNISAAYSGNPPFLLEKGLPMFSYYLIKSNGILTADDVANPKVAKLTGETVGDIKYYDKNSDGIIDANDRVIAGQPTPKYTWGFTNTFRYKGFDLNIQAYGQHGGSIYSFLGRAIDNPANGRQTTLGVWSDRWTADNQNYNAPRGKISYSYTIPLFTTDWLYSSDFWRIQNITLGYNLKSLIKTGVMSGARVYATLQNYFGKDKYKGGGNPEAQNTNVSGDSNFPLPGDYGSMPLNKTVTFGLNLSF